MSSAPMPAIDANHPAQHAVSIACVSKNTAILDLNSGLAQSQKMLILPTVQLNSAFSLLAARDERISKEHVQNLISDAAI